MINEPNVYVLGSLNVDLSIQTERLPAQGETIAGHGFHQAIGGKGGNQACSVASMDVSTFMIGAVGDDSFNAEAKASLHQFGVDTKLVETIFDTPTGTAVIIQSEGDNRIIINAGANQFTSPNVLENPELDVKGDYLLTQFEVPLDAVEAGLAIAKGRGMITAVNPAPASKIDDGTLALIDYLFINQTEAEILTGKYPATVEDCYLVGEELLARGVGHVIVTLGADGAVYIGAEEELYIEGVSIDVVDTTGAGDTFIGVFIAWLAKGETVAEALKWANLAGAYACTKLGAQGGIPSLEALVAFKER